MEPMICLASRSPRRRELLQQIGLPHVLVDVAVDEIYRNGEDVETYVVRLALEKARAGHDALAGESGLPVLAADTVVVIDDEVMCKPRCRTEALEMMARLSGRTHQVLTGVALMSSGLDSRLSVSDVTFRRVTADEADAYWESGEPADKAGGYGIQGLGAVFVSELRGSYSGVMGLPLFETAELLRNVGITLP